MTPETFHLLAYSTALTAGQTDTQLAAVAEQQYNRSNSSFQMPEAVKALLAIGFGVNMSRARINTGSLLPRGLPQIWPVGIAATPPANLTICDWRDMPLQLRKEEDLRVDGSQTDAGTQRANVGIWIGSNAPNYNINGRDLRWLRFTATPTETAFAWCTPVSLVFQDTLEAGQYDIYGLDVFSANTLFARLVLQGMWCRPGIVARTTVGDRGTDIFKGGMGKFGSFNLYSLPQIETLATTAGAATLEGRLLVAKAA